MVCAFGTPRRHPESGIYWFRKRVPDRLRAKVGKREIKFSLRTRDPALARLRNLEAAVEIERAWAGVDLVGVDEATSAFVPIQCKDSRSIAPASGEPTTDQESPKSTASTAVGSIKLRAIFESYAQEAELAPATVKRWSPIMDRLTAHLATTTPGASSGATSGKLRT